MENKTLLNGNPEINIEEEQKRNVKFKFFLIFLVMFMIVISKLSKNEITIDDFYRFSFNLSFHRLYEVKNYLLFFAIIIPLCYFLTKSNNEWLSSEIDKFIDKEEQKEKEEAEKKQLEFEQKMRGVHFKSE